MSTEHIVRIPLDLAGLEQFERPGFEDVAVLGIPLGGEHYEVTFRRMPSHSHTAPTEPSRPATRQEIADLTYRLWLALTACVGRRPTRNGYRPDCMSLGYTTKHKAPSTTQP